MNQFRATLQVLATSRKLLAGFSQALPHSRSSLAASLRAFSISHALSHIPLAVSRKFKYVCDKSACVQDMCLLCLDATILSISCVAYPHAGSASLHLLFQPRSSPVPIQQHSRMLATLAKLLVQVRGKCHAAMASKYHDTYTHSEV
jgi:hypothetical protein